MTQTAPSDPQTPNWTIDSFDALTASDGTLAFAQTVLVVTDLLEGVASIGQMLISLGYRVQVALIQDYTVRGMPDGEPDAILLCLSDRVADASSLLSALKAHIQSPLIPVIGYLTAETDRPDSFDSVLFQPCHPKQVAGRVDAMIRLQAMEHEILRRTQVLRLNFDQEHHLTPDALSRPLRVIFIGKAKPEFMVVLNALRARKVEVVAAFTSFTAFDYLHGREFDAVIIDAMENDEPASSILSSMVRNVRMFHVPKIVMVRPERDASDALDKATDIIRSDSDTTELVNRILEPANYHRIHSQLRAEFEGIGNSDTRDPDTGLFNRAYLESYLDFLASEGEHRTVCVVRLSPQATFSVDEPFIRVALAQAGGIISGLVRINDLTARLSDDSFAITVPPMPDDHLVSLTQRVTDVIECAAFESGKKGAGAFTLNVSVTIERDADSIPAATRVSRILAA